MSLRIAMPLVLGTATLIVAEGLIWTPAVQSSERPPELRVHYHPPRGYVCHRAKSPIVLDGKLDDAAWQDVAWSEDFVDIEGNAKPKPRLRTRMKMTWDDHALYIAAELEEPHIR